MKCPLMKIARGAGGAMESECMKLDCAWYDNAKEQCCIKTLAQLKVSGLVSTHPA